MARPASYIVVYDISKNRERTQVSKILSGYGQRVQESVFECRLSVGMKEKLRKTLIALDLQSGFILVYRLHERSKRTVVGNVPEGFAQVEEHAFVV